MTVRRVAEMFRGAPLRGWLAGVWADVMDAWFPCMCAVCGVATCRGKFLCDSCATGVIRLRREDGGEVIRGVREWGKGGGVEGRLGMGGAGVGEAKMGGDAWGMHKSQAHHKDAGGAYGAYGARGVATRRGALCVCCSRLFEGAEAAQGEFCGPCAECTRLRPAFLCAVQAAGRLDAGGVGGSAATESAGGGVGASAVASLKAADAWIQSSGPSGGRAGEAHWRRSLGCTGAGS